MSISESPHVASSESSISDSDEKSLSSGPGIFLAGVRGLVDEGVNVTSFDGCDARRGSVAESGNPDDRLS